MQWITVDKDRVVASMATARRQMYDGWILANPAKAARVEELIANLVMEFRSGVEANPRNRMDPDPATLPQTCVRYCEELCVFEICMEMGATLTAGELLSESKAEIFLRYMFSGRFYMTGGDGQDVPSPWYGEAAERKAKAVEA